MKKIFLFFLLVFFFLPVVMVVNAATFSFDKSSYSVAVNQTLQVQLNIDVGSEQVDGADAYINYDSSILSVESIAAGSFFPSVIHDTGTPGIFSISGMVEEQANPKTGSGTVATITFKGLKNGTTNLKFDCNNSKIVKHDVNVANILECSSIQDVSIAVGSSNNNSSDQTNINTNNNSNNTSNSSSNNSNNSSPNTLPKTGIFDNLIKFAVPGAILFLIGGGLKLFLLK